MRLQTQDTSLVSDGILAAHCANLSDYIGVLRDACADHTYSSPETSLAAPSDASFRELAHKAAREMGDGVRTVILVGIGGSDLGTRALYNALYGHSDTLVQEHTRKLVAFDTIEPSLLSRVRTLLNAHKTPEEVALVVISKSGTTAESIANGNVLFEHLKKRFGSEAAAKRTICISDHDAPLSVQVKEKGVYHVAMPKMIGGRYSVFSPVGLVPLALLGVDIDALCDGAANAARASTPERGYGPAAVLAALLFEHYLNDRQIHEMFLFHPELETLGKWYRQLLAESIGKEREDGTRVGIMPTVAIGSTDLHSLGQLVLGGPRNRFTTFVAAPTRWNDSVAYAQDSPFTLSMLENKKVGDVMQAIYGGVRTTYGKGELPYASIELSDINERELGAYMALHMATVMYLGRLFGVNVFDQPAVESYKTEARGLLTQEK